MRSFKDDESMMFETRHQLDFGEFGTERRRNKRQYLDQAEEYKVDEADEEAEDLYKELTKSFFIELIE